MHDFAKERIFAPALTKLAAPRTVRHHAEWSTAMITDLTQPHHTPHRVALILDRRGVALILDRRDALACSLSTEKAGLQ